MNTIKKVAKHYDVSVKEVRKDFEEIIKVGMSSTEPEAVMFWSQFGGMTPTPEQFIAALTAAAKAELAKKIIPGISTGDSKVRRLFFISEKLF